MLIQQNIYTPERSNRPSPCLLKRVSKNPFVWGVGDTWDMLRRNILEIRHGGAAFQTMMSFADEAGPQALYCSVSALVAAVKRHV